MTNKKIDALLAAFSVGGRMNPEPSRALVARMYGDPAYGVRYEAETYGTKEIERLLRPEFDNWVRWGFRRDWMPQGFKCPLGFVYKSSDVMQGLRVRPPPCDEIAAERMERIICALPERMRAAFVMYRLDRARVSGHVVVVQGRKRKAELLGVGVGQYHYLVRQAHREIYAQWRKRASL